MPVAAFVFGSALEPTDETHELFDGFFVSFLAFLNAGEFRIAQHTCLAVTAGPGNKRCRAGGEKVNPIEWAFLLIKTDRAALDPVFADIIAIEIKVERRFQFAGM